MNANASPSRRRLRLFQIACVSLFATTSTTTTGFVTIATPQHHHQPQERTSPVRRSPPSSAGLNLRRSALGAAISDFCPTSPAGGDLKKTPLLTGEEEGDLLRRAVEYRRLSTLERDLAMQRPTMQLPLLSVRARAAGYGDELDAYTDAMYEGQKAREQLVTRNMGLVHYCVNGIIGKAAGGGASGTPSKVRHARRERNSGLPLNFLSREDLVQEGAIGLARAVDRWNPEIGGKFSTYAVYWVRAAILRCIAERDDMLRVPSHVTEAVSKINKAARRLGWELDTAGMVSFGAGAISSSNPLRSVSWQEANTAKKLAVEAGLSDRTYEEAMKVRGRRYSGGYVPFEQWMQRGRNMESDVVVASASVGSDDRDGAVSGDSTDELRSVLSKFLRPKEMEALSWRYGLLKDDPAVGSESAMERANRQFSEMEDQLFGATPAATTAVATAAAKVPIAAASMSEGPAKGRFGEAMTFTEVGKKMQVSAEYTRKLCHQALDKLRLAAAEGRLEPALLI